MWVRLFAVSTGERNEDTDMESRYTLDHSATPHKQYI